jgi:hypothetical protein
MLCGADMELGSKRGVLVLGMGHLLVVFIRTGQELHKSSYMYMVVPKKISLLLAML